MPNPSYTTRRLYACANATKRLMHKGNHNPKIKEVVEEAHGDSPFAIGPSEIEWVVKHASQIKDILSREEDMTVILVRQLFYTHRRRMPATMEEAFLVLAHKGEAKPAGFHWAKESDDTIWEAYQQRREGQHVGGIGQWAREINRAVKQNRLSLDNGERSIRQIKNKI